MKKSWKFNESNIFAVGLMATAQDYKRFKVAIGLGYAAPTAGIGFYLPDGGYRVHGFYPRVGVDFGHYNITLDLQYFAITICICQHIRFDGIWLPNKTLLLWIQDRLQHWRRQEIVWLLLGSNPSRLDFIQYFRKGMKAHLNCISVKQTFIIAVQMEHLIGSVEFV